MKYKNLKPFSHNFSHSFVSYENYFDDEYIVEEFLSCAREVLGKVVTVEWLPEFKVTNIELSPKANKSLAYYQEWLPILAKQHGVNLEAIVSYRTELSIDGNSTIKILSCLTDDRGTIHEQEVKL